MGDLNTRFKRSVPNTLQMTDLCNGDVTYQSGADEVHGPNDNGSTISTICIDNKLLSIMLEQKLTTLSKKTLRKKDLLVSEVATCITSSRLLDNLSDVCSAALRCALRPRPIAGNTVSLNGRLSDYSGHCSGCW